MAKKAVTKKRSGPKVKKTNMSQTVRDYAEKHGLTKADSQKIADALGYTYNTVYQAFKSAKKAGKKAVKKAHTFASEHESDTKKASNLLHTAAGIGLDKAIEILQRVKKAIGP